MAEKQKTAFCNVCNEQRRALSTRPNHTLHLVLTILTAGAWGLFVWLPLYLVKAGDYRCTQCGTKV